jgi:hypothetical protein
MLAWLLAGLLAGCATPPAAGPARSAIEARFETLKATPPRLDAFLRAMPKGADLHSHLSGAVYAESYIAWAIADGLCLVVATQSLAAPPCEAASGRPPLATAMADTAAYNALIDAFSMRNHEKGGASGHDQFFATFARFGAAGNQRGTEMLVEVIARAAEQNVHHLELMTSPGMAAARVLGRQVGWIDDPDRHLEALRRQGLDAIAAQAAAELAAGQSALHESLGCAGSTPQAACAVSVRYLAQVIRNFPKEQVFAQIALGFVLAAQSPLVVGINLVAPEDDRVSLVDYSDHMRMVGALRRHYPQVGISLHAGELALGLVPPQALRFHIAQAVRVAGATRIGHGVDILHEDGAEDLLAEMARKAVMVEINLSSNDLILGVSGHQHPYAAYRAHGVPMALSTDDEGVSRIDLTHEYRRAVLTYDLGYAELKQLSRNGLSHAFVSGESLWQDASRALPVKACGADTLGDRSPSVGCAAFLGASAKATLQWRLEADYQRFERAALAQRP